MSGVAGEGAEEQALQSALEAEYAAVYAYGVIGGVLGASSAVANSAYAAHRGRRDQLISMIGDNAIVAEPFYALPFEVRGPARARRLARVIEARCSAVYADVVTRTTASTRLYAARALTDCAVRGLAWGDDPEPFPGLSDR